MIPDTVVQSALALIKLRSENYRHFFDNLPSSDWIGPLAAKGFFIDPPQVVRENGYIMQPLWPESRFLVRCAKDSPEEVASLFLLMPETENARVYEDMAEAALAMPIEIAVQLVKPLAKVATIPYSFTLPGRLADFAFALHIAGFKLEAIEILTKLLSLDAIEDDSLSATQQSVKPLLEQHHFESVLETLAKDYVPHMGGDTLDLLIATIIEYFRLTTNTRDTEYLWLTRPAIETHDQNSPISNGVLFSLIDATRDIGLALSRAGSISNVIQHLSTPNLLILHRIAMHILAEEDKPPLEWITFYLKNKQNFVSESFHHEYFKLLEKHFIHLTRDSQETVLRWIDDLANAEELRRSRISKGYECNEEDAEFISSYRKLERLFPIKDHLVGDRQSEYLMLVSRFGEPEHPDFLVYHHPIRWGSTGPVSADAMAQMEPAAVVDLIRNWTPPGDSFSGPTVDGLARQVEDRVKADPALFAASAHLFRGLDPIYVRSFFSGIRHTVNSGTKPDWLPLLDLATWVVAQVEQPTSQSRRLSDGDPGWNWTRKEISHLLVLGLGKQDVEPPREAQEAIWCLLAILSDDPDPTPEYESTYGGGNMNPPTLSLNTVRPIAIRAVILYALWVFRTEESAPFSFASVPDADALLSNHLDHSIDPSLAVRSVYGELCPFIAKLDEQRFVELRETIFDRSAGNREYWHAAWDTYITHCQPYDIMLGLLQDEYRHAIDLAEEESGDGRHPRASESLGVHLLVFYGRGQLGLGGESLFDYFLSHTTPGIRKLGLVGLGHALLHSKSVAPSFAKRFIPLWERILADSINLEREQRVELAAFGWWFGAGVFDPAWALETLLKVLEATPSLELSHIVIEKLAEVAADYPAQSIRALRLLFRFDSERMNFYERDEITKVLVEALNSESRDRAVEFIHLLGASGFSWPGKLL